MTRRRSPRIVAPGRLPERRRRVARFWRDWNTDHRPQPQQPAPRLHTGQWRAGDANLVVHRLTDTHPSVVRCSGDRPVSPWWLAILAPADPEWPVSTDCRTCGL